MALPLSVLDLSPVDANSGNAQVLQNTLALARLADRLGYTRYWLAEHLNMGMLASSTPEIMIGYMAQATERTRSCAGEVAHVTIAAWNKMEEG